MPAGEADAILGNLHNGFCGGVRKGDLLNHFGVTQAICDHGSKINRVASRRRDRNGDHCSRRGNRNRRFIEAHTLIQVIGLTRFADNSFRINVHPQVKAAT